MANIRSVFMDLLLGTRKKKLISGAILLIIAFLLHVRNMNANAETMKLKLRDKDRKKVPPP